MQIEFHPLANLFPLMEGAEFDALVADIKAHGLREPVIIHDGKILDGRNRFRACQKAAVEASTVEWDQKGTAQEFVVSKNLHRRHLNESQRAMIAGKLANISRGEVGGGHKKADGQISTSDAAELLSVSRHSVQDAKLVHREGTGEEISAIEKGNASVNTVAKQIRAKIPAVKRAKKRAEPLSQRGNNPERIQRQQLNAEIWGHVRESLVHLTSLPLPAEVVAIARANDRTGLVDDRLARALQWLKDFSDAWTH